MYKHFIKFCLLVLLLPVATNTNAQTDMDAIMMSKKQFCLGPMYSHSSWKNYWEGQLKRDNPNIGTITTQAFAVMGAYGVTDKLNLLFNVPYLSTKASQGTMRGMQGVQDLSLIAKYMPIEKEIGPGTFSLYTIGGVSLPLTNYVADYLPLSIGLKSRSAMARLMLDYQINSFFVTGSATYVLRDNIKLDRNSYYTTHLILSNEVEMPNASNLNFRAGYRSAVLIAEAVLNHWTTHGGFDITRNNMPFPSNRMNATTLGINFKYNFTADHTLALVGGFNSTIAGRNMGQASTYYGGLFYVLDFSPKEKTKKE
jgi:hypothetical protein